MASAGRWWRGAAGNATVRRHNLLLALDWVRHHSPTTRTAVAAGTGLAKGSVTAMVGRLLELGLVSEHSERDVHGRTTVHLLPAGGGRVVMALQVAVDDIVLRAVDLAGHVRFEGRWAHGRPMGRPDLIADVMADAAGTATGSLEAQGLTTVALRVVMAAPVAFDPPTIPAAVDFGWVQVDLMDLLRRRLGFLELDLSLANDAAMAALAEREAMAESPEDMVYLKSDTGIGGAAFVGGRLLRGAHGMGFEPGHMVVDPGGRRCACGQRGCLVTVAGPEVVLRQAGLGAKADAEGVSPALEELEARLGAGDPRACAALAEATRWLARALTTIRTLFEPQVIVLGGYWAGTIETIRAELDRIWAEDRPHLPHWDASIVRPSKLAGSGPLAGALEDLTARATARLLTEG